MLLVSAADSSWLVVWRKTIASYEYVTALLWRVAEIHIHKLVMLIIFIHCTREVTKLHLVYNQFLFSPNALNRLSRLDIAADSLQVGCAMYREKTALLCATIL